MTTSTSTSTSTSTFTAAEASERRCEATTNELVDGDLEAAVHRAVASVNDPEYPDVSIVDLGLLVSLDVDGRSAAIDLVPTFTGCPALAMIAGDVEAAVRSVDGIDAATVTWRRDVVWDTDRMSFAARRRLASDYTVTLRRKDGTLRCPVCGSDAVTDQSMAGPSRCRSVAWCPSCRNPIEVMRA